MLASLGFTSTVEGLELQLQALAAHKERQALLAHFGNVERRLLDISIKLSELDKDVKAGFMNVQATLKVGAPMGTRICLK